MLNNATLIELYPNIFNIVMDKDSSVAQNMTNNTWGVYFRRLLQGLELRSLMEMSVEVKLTGSMEVSQIGYEDA